MGDLTVLIEQTGIPVGLFITIFVWSYIWKLLALWKSARKKSVVWFIILALVNTVGILEILYIFIFAQLKPHKEVHEAYRRKLRKKKRRK